jgi:hypothetical protein
MANQSVAATSSFCTFAMVATFVTVYYWEPRPDSPNAWLLRYPDQWTDALTGRRNLVLFREPQILTSSQLQQLWNAKGDGAVLTWFRGIPAMKTSSFRLYQSMVQVQ